MTSSGGNFTILLTSSGQECNFTLLLTSSRQQMAISIAIDI